VPLRLLCLDLVAIEPRPDKLTATRAGQGEERSALG